LAKQKREKTEIVAFACHWGGFPLLEGAGIDSSGDVRLVRLMCGGRMSAGLVLRAFENGADGVAVVACEERECHYGFGAAKWAEEFELTKKMTHLLGIGRERLTYCAVHPGDVEKARADLGEFVRTVGKAGKLNVRAEEG